MEDSQGPWGTAGMGEEPNAADDDGISEGGIDALISAFSRWSGDEQLRRRAAERSRERWLRQQALDAATLRGILVDLAERGANVGLQTSNHLLRGRLIGTGQDLAVLEDRQRCATIVNLATLVSVDVLGTPSGHGSPLLGHRPPLLPLRFSDALATLAAELFPVRLHLPGEDVRGDLMAVGEDVVVLGLSSGRRYHYVNLARVEACSLR